MRCNDAVRILHEADGKLTESISAGIHVFFCADCRKFFAQVKKAEAALPEYAPYPLPADFTNDIMVRIRTLSMQELHETKKVPLSGWIAVGIIILSGMYALTQSVSHVWLKGRMGSDLEIPLNIAMGVVITIYAAFFIGTHLDELVERFGIKRGN